jgi:RNA polymerase sigma factor (TIGR02999 family)
MFEQLYAELLELARARTRREAPGRATRPTSLVHAVWLRWVASKKAEPRTREEFLGIAARIMRQVLVDHARARAALKRGGGAPALLLEDRHLARERPGIDVLELDEALKRLDRLHPRQRGVVEMMFFAGMTQPEVAKVLSVSERTVRGDWISAQAWLRAELRPE